LSLDLERVYTINLGKVLLSANTHRATRAINMIKEFARHHMKVETIKIEEDLAQHIWSRGARSPPRKIRVRMNKTDDGYVLVSRFDEDAEPEITTKKDSKKIEPKVDTEKETPETEIQEKETQEKEIQEKEKPEKETPSKVKPAKAKSDKVKPAKAKSDKAKPSKKTKAK
jgi:large subunit ribosomal protein L31e